MDFLELKLPRTINLNIVLNYRLLHRINLCAKFNLIKLWGTIVFMNLNYLVEIN